MAWQVIPDRNCDGQCHGSSNDSKEQFQTVFFKMRPALSLNGFTSHQLRLIQFVTKKHFDNLVYVHVHVDGDNSCLQQLVVYTDSKADNDLLMKEVRDERCKGEEMKVKAAVGFRHVIDLLSSEKKLIVGHNCFLDIAHIYKKLFGPLPSTANEFVALVNKYFPYVIDTKVLLNSNLVLRQRMKIIGTSLSRAFSSLCPQIALGSKGQDLLFKTYMKVEVHVDDMRFVLNFLSLMYSFGQITKRCELDEPHPSLLLPPSFREGASCGAMCNGCTITCTISFCPDLQLPF